MSKIARLTLAVIMVLSLALMMTAKTDTAYALEFNGFVYKPPFPDFNWIAPDGLPEGVSARELYLENPFEFNFNGQTYAPPTVWQTFAGAAYKLSFKGALEEPIKICFYYPKTLFNGTWHGQIYRMSGASWVGLPTTEEMLSFEGHGAFPFLCTNATLPGVYIVVDYWTSDGYVPPPLPEMPEPT